VNGGNRGNADLHCWSVLQDHETWTSAERLAGVTHRANARDVSLGSILDHTDRRDATCDQSEYDRLDNHWLRNEITG
jgi:hypothetical protein